MGAATCREHAAHRDTLVTDLLTTIRLVNSERLRVLGEHMYDLGQLDLLTPEAWKALVGATGRRPRVPSPETQAQTIREGRLLAAPRPALAPLALVPPPAPSVLVIEKPDHRLGVLAHGPDDLVEEWAAKKRAYAASPEGQAYGASVSTWRRGTELQAYFHQHGSCD